MFTPSMLLADKFRLALAFVLEHEGGYVNDPADPGGETKYGISKRSYPSIDIKKLTAEQAGQIYRTDFWDRCHCDGYDYPLALAVFDSAVNCGCGKAMLWAKDCAGRAEVVLFNRMMHYIKLDKIKYTGGWMKRVVSCYNEGKKYG